MVQQSWEVAVFYQATTNVKWKKMSGKKKQFAEMDKKCTTLWKESPKDDIS